MGLIGLIAAWTRPGHSPASLVAAAVLSIMAWPLLTAAAHGPGIEAGAPAIKKPVQVATLSRQGDELIITGSVAALFNTGNFAGPNRAEKVNRARLTPDGTTVSAGFAAMRTQLAELRNPQPSPSALASAMQRGGGTVEVASIDPSQNAALGAIDQIVPLPPMPMMATPQLAYARDTTPATAFDFSIDKFGKKVSQKDIWCMATAIYFEARGEAYRGQVAVGQVVMNRVAHPIYPKSICQVVFQNQQMHNACQFSFACDGIPETINDPVAWKQADTIARGVISGSLYLPEVGKATHYHANYVYPDWAPRLKRVTKIGHHIFYQFKRSA